MGSTTFSSAPQAANNAKEVTSKNLIDDGILNLRYMRSDYTIAGIFIIRMSIPELKKEKLQINPEKVLLLYLPEDVGKMKRYRRQRFSWEASRFVEEREFL